MSPILQNPLSHSRHRIKFNFLNTPTLSNPSKIPKSSISYKPSILPPSKTFVNKRLPLHNLSSFRHSYWRIKTYNSSTATVEEYEIPSKPFNFDALLYALESLCVISSVIISVGCIVNWVFFRQQNLGLLALGNRVLVILLAGAVAIGSVIRRRQWRRVCGLPPSSKSELGSGNGNMIERIEKLEESMKSATTIIRMLSRQLEKLGVRFRLYKKALKEPIAETAALAQKNSEATRALAKQESILEKELAEVQNVLLAMQDQQHKQLELILALAKSGKLFDTKQEAPSQGPVLNEKDPADKGLRRVDAQHIKAIPGQKLATNDIA